METSSNYFHLMQIRSQSKWIKKYWKSGLDNFPEETKSNINLMQENLQIKKKKTITYSNVPQYIRNISLTKALSRSDFNWCLDKHINFTLKKKVNFLKKGGCFSHSIAKSPLNKNFFVVNNYVNQEESFNNVKNQMGKRNSVYLVKKPVNKLFSKEYGLKKNFFFKFRFNDENSTLNHKTSTKPHYFSFKQKRYKIRKRISTEIFKHKYKDFKKKPLKFRGTLDLKNNSHLKINTKTGTSFHRMVKKCKIRSENINVTTSKRLLRVKKTLVVPTHVNITAITNSYDVVHSWFIPGLGLKMDCVPGRSTHHTFYVDNAGFYYGQCAEICGRFHHHMPIRVCALPFEHFLLWWNTFGLPKFVKANKKEFVRQHSFRKFVW